MLDKPEPTRLEKIAAELSKLGREFGTIEARTVWQYARDNPKSPLHSEFTWNEREAAEAHWTERARELIRQCGKLIQYRETEVQFRVPQFVHDVRSDEGGYIETAAIKAKEHRQETLRAEMDRIRSGIHRAMALAVAFGLVSHFEKALAEIIAAEKMLIHRK